MSYTVRRQQHHQVSQISPRFNALDPTVCQGVSHQLLTLIQYLLKYLWSAAQWLDNGLYGMHMNVLPICMCVYHIHVFGCKMRTIDPLELESVVHCGQYLLWSTSSLSVWWHTVSHQSWLCSSTQNDSSIHWDGISWPFSSSSQASCLTQVGSQDSG